MQIIAGMFAALTFLGPIFVSLIFAQKHLFNITPSIIVTLSLIANHIVTSLSDITKFQTSIQSTRILRKFEVVNEQILPLKKKHINRIPSLIVTDLSITLENKRIFSHINLRLNPDEKILVTRKSGVGKTTFLKAIAGIIKPSSGSVKLGKAFLTPADYTYISQNVWLFSDTLRNNLTLFEKYTDQELGMVLKEVGLWDELPNDPLEMIIKEDHSNISGGQAQRIAIARGLLRKKQLFLLDEITSSLDNENSDEIRKLIYSLPISMIEIAHNYDATLLKKYHVKIARFERNGLKVEKY
ncbi:ATP-binding cassette domain-containing protein [Lactobacillus helveticus]|uniref:ABC transporter domain-containing protein n=2 Tax=Lactobacillus helveticus TaxID=1587 RepID=A0AAV4E364_LACHE|nr:ATP-binding cassette domain-containing protein [Lactobacillus helveticus]KXN78201.1 hypothetical protein AY471_10420 [Lactobacillus helveticus]MBU5981464.1 ATP-binding cassette domain-containing protein [Lactobacillus helveticus]MBU6034994.1 ATP-binding cassette domain-containing protein [Lactobacillus helveticus]MBW1220627.1 ATP-binding cassette domain-containing protein [Lactobacillus helveticus]MBW7980516.1 ATP-binding cassette domain-containing protein [Lactobacillus helveticus]